MTVETITTIATIISGFLCPISLALLFLSYFVNDDQRKESFLRSCSFSLAGITSVLSLEGSSGFEIYCVAFASYYFYKYRNLIKEEKRD